jgi:ACS family allantoate permease-like MFS transporter
MIGSCAIAYFFAIALIASNVLGTTKKVTTDTIVFLSTAISYIVGPQIFHGAPYYVKSKYATLRMWCGAILTLFAIRALHVWKNMKRDREWVGAGSVPALPDTEFLD